MAIEFREFSLALASRSRILGDDSASVATLGIPSPLDYQVNDTDNNSDMDTSDGEKPGTYSTATGSSPTDMTPQLFVNDSTANVLANTSLDPSIRQAILNIQKAVDMARGDS
jgi:hypothetical protein